MKVIKKDGRIQEFESEKITISILSATSESMQLLNESDVKIIVQDVVAKLEEIRKESEYTSSYEITGAVIGILKRDGFSDVIGKYVGYKKE